MTPPLRGVFLYGVVTASELCLLARHVMIARRGLNAYEGGIRSVTLARVAELVPSSIQIARRLYI